MTNDTFTGVFMFTDIVGSTSLWADDPKAMFTTVVAHNDGLRRCVEMHGGAVVKYRGDGVHAVFTDRIGAIKAAHAAQRCVADEAWPVPIKIRVALHHGEAIAHDGDFYGPAVNVAARLVDWVRPGETVITTTVLASACADLIPIEQVRLRDIREPISVATIPSGHAARHEDHLTIDLRTPRPADPPSSDRERSASVSPGSFGCRIRRPDQLSLAA